MLWTLAIALAGPADDLAVWVADECSAASVEVLSLGIPEPYPEGAWFFSGLPCRRAPRIRVTVVDGGVEILDRSARPILDVQVASLVVGEPVAAGEAVNYVPGTVAVEKLVGQPVGEGAWRARRDLFAGEPLTSSNVEPLPDALRGAEIELVAGRGPLTVQAAGTLLTDARIGERVRAQNHATKVGVSGVLIDPGTVAVD